MKAEFSGKEDKFNRTGMKCRYNPYWVILKKNHIDGVKFEDMTEEDMQIHCQEEFDLYGE